MSREICRVVECIPLTLELHNRAVGGVAPHRIHENALGCIWPGNIIGDRVLHTVDRGITVGIDKIIPPVFLEHPGSLMKTRETACNISVRAKQHDTLAFHLKPVVTLQFCHPASALSGSEHIGLSVVIHKQTRIYCRGNTVNISYTFPRTGRIFACSKKVLPYRLSVHTYSVRIDKVVQTVRGIVIAVGRPHILLAIIVDSSCIPVGCRGIHYLAMVGPVYHILGRKDMVAIHMVAPLCGRHVMRGI